MISNICLFFQFSVSRTIPVNNDRNQKLYAQYADLAKKEYNVIFGGRLAEYKYYDMDDVIKSALDVVEKELL